MATESGTIVITTTLQSSPAVFDLSGTVPFSINVCVVRRNTSGRLDPDARPIKILVKESLLDIPYALKTGLIHVVEFANESGSTSVGGKILDFNDIDVELTSSDCVTIESPVDFDHTGQWAYKDRFIAVKHMILFKSQIGSRFTSYKRYDVRFKDKDKALQLDFPQRCWSFADSSLLSDPPADALGGPEGWKLRLVSSRIGQSHFSTRMSVSIPPTVDVRLSWGNPQTELEPSFTCKDKPSIIARITNKAERSITVQCYGEQHFIDPRKRIEPSQGDSRPRITAQDCSVTNLFQVTDLGIGRTCKEAQKPASSHGDSMFRLPGRNFFRFEPGRTETRTHRLDWPIFDGLEPGHYKLNLPSHGAWWSWKSVEELCGEEMGLVSTYGQEPVAPVMLSSPDELTFNLRTT